MVTSAKLLKAFLSARSLSSSLAIVLAGSLGQFSRTQSEHLVLLRSLKCAMHRSRCRKSAPQHGQVLDPTYSRIFTRSPCFARQCDSRAFWEAKAQSHMRQANPRCCCKASCWSRFESHTDSAKKRSAITRRQVTSSVMIEHHPIGLSQKLPMAGGMTLVRIKCSMSLATCSTHGSRLPFLLRCSRPSSALGRCRTIRPRNCNLARAMMQSMLGCLRWTLTWRSVISVSSEKRI